MYIRRLIIDDFGALRKKEFSFSSGLNLLVGGNESGKSTVCAFIKYVFYGFSDSKERERHSNLETMCAGGSVEIEFAGEVYLISRRDGDKGRSKVSVFTEDGSEFDAWKLSAQTPGEYFLGIPEKLYSRSLYVSQTSGAEPDGASASAISNLLLSGDEAVNLKNATNKLEALRKSLQLKKGRGGLIPKKEEEIDALKEKYLDALTVRTRCECLASELKNANEDLTIMRAKLSRTEEEFCKKRSAKIVEFLRERDCLTKEYEDAQEQLTLLQNENTYEGFCPSESYITEIEKLETEAQLRNNTCQTLKERLSECRDERNAKIPKEYRAFLSLGRTSAILAKHNDLCKKKRVFGVLALLSLIISIGTGAGALFNTILLPFSIAFLLAAFAQGYLALNYSKKLKEFLYELSPDGVSPAEVCAACDEYEVLRNSESASISKAFSDESELLAKTLDELSYLAEKWGKSSASEAKQYYLAFSAKRAELHSCISELKRARDVNQAHLSAYSENDKAKAMKYSEEELIGAENIVISEEAIYSLRNSVSAIEAERHSLEVSLASEGFESIDPAKTICELNSATDKLKQLNASFDAVTLALSSLSNAEESIRRTVSPYLSKVSSVYFSKITNGKYPELKLDADLALKYVSPEYSFPVSGEYLSGGSADLAWLCLRLALHSKLSESHPLPLILDECLVYFDDERLKAILSELETIASEGTQILLFSASSRERTILDDEYAIEV